MLIESEELRKRLLEKRELNFRTLGNPNKLDGGLMQALAVLGSYEAETTRNNRATNDKERQEAEAAERVREMFGLSEDEWADRHRN